MLLMLKVATFTESISVLSASSHPPVHKTQVAGHPYMFVMSARSKGRAMRPVAAREEFAATGLDFTDPFRIKGNTAFRRGVPSTETVTLRFSLTCMLAAKFLSRNLLGRGHVQTGGLVQLSEPSPSDSARTRRSWNG